MNEQMRHLIAAIYQQSMVVPVVQVPSEVFRRMAEQYMRSTDVEDAKIINQESK